ncbi:MAG: TonB-dependent receptor [Candidatus Angelobacter sp.]|nr:TonB-dependent receptor [Candidatus Angelobacter sp.]
MTTKFRGYRLALAVIATLGILFSLTLPLAAQDATGKVVGTVTDPQGAVVAGAKVTVTNTATSVTREATTAADGTFLVNALPIGNYTVAVQKNGFTKAVSPVQQLFINQNLRMDMKLAVGASTETVEVQAQAAGVETINATLGQSVTSRPLVNLPLNGRNVFQLALLQPGVTESNNPGNTSGGSGFSIAGGRGDSVTYLLDGGMNNNLLNNAPVYNPNPDAIAEFKILTSNYTAEYGRNGGGIISVVTKSGSNGLHGSAFEFVRNEDLNANSYFNKQQGFQRDILKRNQFGGTLGGPVIKNKAFFFVAYQVQRLVQQVSNTPQPTFTPRELTGDFSKSSGGAPDQNVVTFLQANPFYQPNTALAAQGIIDPNKIDPVAKKYIAAGLIPTSATGILNEQGPGKDNNTELTTKFDFNFTDRDKLGITLGRTPRSVVANYRSNGNTGSVFSSSNKYPIANESTNLFSSIAYTKIFTSNVLNEARFTAQRAHGISFTPGATLPVPSALGVGVTPDLPNGPPRLGFGSGMSLGFSPNGPQDIVNNTFIYSDTVSWTKGKHNWKFGFNFSPYQNNTVYDFYGDGEFDFYGTGGGSFSQNDFADFLMGLPDEYFQFGNAPSNIRSKSYYGFAQDEWHVRHNLTLTLGIRYEYSSPKLDTQGRSFSLAKGKQSTVFTKAPVGVLFPGDAGAPTGANFPDKNDWAPRVGFAWDPFSKGKTSIRGGFGVFYDVLKGEDNLQFNGQAPFFGFGDIFFDPIANPAASPGYFNTPWTTNNSGTPNSFPSKPPASNIDFAAAGFTPFGGGGVYFVDPNLRTPYTYQYNLSVQQQLPSSVTFETSYVGSRSKKLTSLVDSNPFVLGTGTRTFNTVPGASFARLDTFRNVSSAYYDSMQTSLTKQNSDTAWLGNTYFTLAYTWAHNIDTASGFRNRTSKVSYYQPNRNRASSDFDIAHRITFSGGWDLPLDRKWSNRLTKGWSIYPIVSWRTGFALDVLGGLPASSGNSGPSGAGDRELVYANLVGATAQFDPHTTQTFSLPICPGDQVRAGTGAFFFNPTVFNKCYPSTGAVQANPALATYGTLPRNFFRGPGRINADMTIAKNTQVYERLNMEFKADIFNVFNHAEFDNPQTNILSSQFGQVTGTGSPGNPQPRIIQLAVKFTF